MKNNWQSVVIGLLVSVAAVALIVNARFELAPPRYPEQWQTPVHAQQSAGDLAGYWANVDADTDGTTCMEITADGWVQRRCAWGEGENRQPRERLLVFRQWDGAQLYGLTHVNPSPNDHAYAMYKVHEGYLVRRDFRQHDESESLTSVERFRRIDQLPEPRGEVVDWPVRTWPEMWDRTH